MEKTNFSENNITCKYNLFYLITIALLTTVIIYCYLIKYRAKQKHLLPLRGTKLKHVSIDNIN